MRFFRKPELHISSKLRNQQQLSIEDEDLELFQRIKQYIGGGEVIDVVEDKIWTNRSFKFLKWFAGFVAVVLGDIIANFITSDISLQDVWNNDMSQISIIVIGIIVGAIIAVSLYLVLIHFIKNKF